MAKRKKKKFAEVSEFKNVIQPDIKIHLQTDFELKGKWASEFFGNNNPVVLELGCGKGEYTVGLAGWNPKINYIGIDIKGARIWRGAKTAIEKKLTNVAFIRTHIDLIESFFESGEVSEIWITFPDPQPRKQNKRLTSARFVNMYRTILKPEGNIHLKTDSQLLHYYTLELLKQNSIQPIVSTNNLYEGKITIPELHIKTFYEQQFLAQGLPITYLKFQNPEHDFTEIDKFVLD